MMSLRKVINDERSSVGTGTALTASLLVVVLTLGSLGLVEGARDLHRKASRGTISADLSDGTPSPSRA